MLTEDETLSGGFSASDVVNHFGDRAGTLHWPEVVDHPTLELRTGAIIAALVEPDCSSLRVLVDGKALLDEEVVELEGQLITLTAAALDDRLIRVQATALGLAATFAPLFVPASSVDHVRAAELDVDGLLPQVRATARLDLEGSWRDFPGGWLATP